MLYDVLWSEEDSHSLQQMRVLHPCTLRLMKRILSKWKADFHRNLKNVVVNLSKHKEKSYIIYYSDYWDGKRESRRVMKFEYGSLSSLFAM